MVGGADGLRTCLLVVDAQADVEPVAKTLQDRLLARGGRLRGLCLVLDRRCRITHVGRPVALAAVQAFLAPFSLTFEETATQDAALPVQLAVVTGRPLSR